jgi:sugar lactone lactonase YvrE
MKKSRYIQLIAALGISMLLSYSLNFGQSSILKEVEVEKITEGFQFVEGPLWKNGELLFSDIPANKIYRWSSDHETKILIEPSGNSNGLALDNEGRLLLAQHGERRLARLEVDGSQTPLATHYKGKKLNSPNDIAVKGDGSIFFTDPPYGISNSEEELGFYGIYRISTSGSVQLLDSTLRRPNGIAFSPNEKKLYVSDCEAKIIYVWDVLEDTAIANKKQFASMNVEGSGADGMKVDSQGLLYCTGPLGVWIFDSEGTVIDTIEVPGQTTNCNWAGKDQSTLYVTSGDAVYKLTNFKK